MFSYMWKFGVKLKKYIFDLSERAFTVEMKSYYYNTSTQMSSIWNILRFFRNMFNKGASADRLILPNIA